MIDPRGGDRSLTCRDAIDLLVDYLEAALTPEQLMALEAHLADCKPCQAYLNTYRRTKALIVRVERVEMPAEMRLRLGEFLARHLSSESH